MKMNYYDTSWPLTVDQCACDLQFVQYLELKNMEGKSIFHFGTGEHHLVGKNNHERGNPNEIIGITASIEEHQAYINFILDNPAAANYYKVLFADIYTLSKRTLPSFDIVTLFHFCEFYDEQMSAYARLNDVKLLEMFLSKLNPQGKIIFYKQSDSFDDKASLIVNNFVSHRRLIVEDEYETLLVCGRNW